MAIAVWMMVQYPALTSAPFSVKLNKKFNNPNCERGMRTKNWTYITQIVTSNRPVRDWGLILGDSTAATAILDRLLHHSCVLTINGDSYRLMSARKEKLLEENDKQV